MGRPKKTVKKTVDQVEKIIDDVESPEITTEETTEEKKEKTPTQKAEYKFYLTLKEKYEKAAEDGKGSKADILKKLDQIKNEIKNLRKMIKKI